MAERPFDFGGQSFDWDTYLDVRPKYPKRLYQVIFDHHCEYGNAAWNVGYDMATGGGLVAARLTSEIDHVISSDPSEEYLSAARKFVPSANNGKASTEFLQCRAEDSTGIQPGSVDLITIGEAMHYTDVSKTMQTVAPLLRPGGTFAAWSYEIVPQVLRSDNIGKQIQEAINAVFETFVAYAALKLGSRPAMLLWSDMCWLPFDYHAWRDVRRLYWSRHRSFGPYVTNLIESNPVENNVRPWETMEIDTENILKLEASAEWMGRYLDTLYPKCSFLEFVAMSSMRFKTS